MSDCIVDIAVVGGGPAGLAAAAVAAEHGRTVALIDAALQPGGQIWRSASPDALPRVAHRWLERARSHGVQHIAGAEVVDIVTGPGTFELTLADSVGGDNGARSVRSAQVVLATGARELFLPFPGWTLPGVVGVGGAQALLKSGWSVRGRRIVVAGSGPLLLAVAAALARAGGRIVEVVEQAPRHAVGSYAASLWRQPARLADAARYRAAFRAAPYRTGTWVRSAAGASAVEAVLLTDGRREREVHCDVLCTGYGLAPAVELARLLGCPVHDGAVVVDALQRTAIRGVLCAGEPTGIAGVEAAQLEGRIAGRAAAGLQPPRRLQRQRDAARAAARRMQRAFALRDELRALPRPDTVVCRCEDARYAAVAACGSAREAKLMTRMAMGACQGRVCGPAAHHLFAWSDDTVRAPVFPARIDSMLAEAHGGDR